MTDAATAELSDVPAITSKRRKRPSAAVISWPSAKAKFSLRSEVLGVKDRTATRGRPRLEGDGRETRGGFSPGARSDLAEPPRKRLDVAVMCRWCLPTGRSA